MRIPTRENAEDAEDNLHFLTHIDVSFSRPCRDINNEFCYNILNVFCGSAWLSACGSNKRKQGFIGKQMIAIRMVPWQIPSTMDTSSIAMSPVKEFPQIPSNVI